LLWIATLQLIAQSIMEVGYCATVQLGQKGQRNYGMAASVAVACSHAAPQAATKSAKPVGSPHQLIQARTFSGSRRFTGWPTAAMMDAANWKCCKNGCRRFRWRRFCQLAASAFCAAELCKGPHLVCQQFANIDI
jgi:hypothetical protein